MLLSLAGVGIVSVGEIVCDQVGLTPTPVTEVGSRIVSAVLHVPAFIDDVVGSDNHIIPGVEPAIHERTGDDLIIDEVSNAEECLTLECVPVITSFE